MMPGSGEGLGNALDVIKDDDDATARVADDGAARQILQWAPRQQEFT